MSEKRRRQQDRRTKRQSARRSGSGAGFVDRELAQLMDQMVSIALRSVAGLDDALQAECWASEMMSTWSGRELPDGNAEDVFLPAFVRALERKASPGALVTLRALASLGSESHAKRCRAAVNRLAARGLVEPEWTREVGRAQAVGATMMYETAFDDGFSVFIEFAPPTGEPHAIGIYIDHNMGGLVKDAFLTGPLSDVRSKLSRRADNGVGLEFRELDLAEARARVEAALFMLDHTYDPPVSEDVRNLRALIDARLRQLPTGFELPEEYEEVSVQERQQLVDAFFASPEGERWRGDEQAADVVATAIEFGAGYNHGGPLRWSPVVVEIFMTSWLARKAVREPAFFARVPKVLPDWVRYAGRVSGVPAEPLSEAVRAVKEFRREMLDAVNDPEAWGPAKSFAVAAQEAGVDLADPDAFGAFIDRYNEGLAA